MKSEDFAFAGIVLITLVLCGACLYYNDTYYGILALVMVIFVAVVVLMPEKYDRKLKPDEKPSDLLDFVETEEQIIDKVEKEVEETKPQEQNIGVSVSETIEPIRKCSCGSEEFLAGPEGGLAQNIKCAKCGKEYNDTPLGLEPIIPCDFCNTSCDGKNILKTPEIVKTDGSDVVVCNDCLNLYGAGEWDKLTEKVVANLSHRLIFKTKK